MGTNPLWNCSHSLAVASNSTSWGHYSVDSFSPNANGRYTGAYEQAKANNIYDLAGNNWEWTQERCGSNYVMQRWLQPDGRVLSRQPLSRSHPRPPAWQ